VADVGQRYEPPRPLRIHNVAPHQSPPTNNPRTNSIIPPHTAPSSHGVYNRQEPLRPGIRRMPNSPSRARQNPTKEPGISPPSLGPQSAPMPLLSQPPSQLGLMGALSGHICTTLATLPNEQQAQEPPGKVDPESPYSGDISRGMASPDG